MTGPLDIPATGAIDFLSLGALVHRLDSGVVPFRKASRVDVHVSGGEFNVAANLADCFGLDAAVATAMVDYPVGDLIAERVRAMGVRAFYKRYPHDGVTGPAMAAVYSDRGFGVRPPVVFYNRANEAAARLRPGDFDWDAIFAQGVRWFHSGGIFAALSETTGAVIVEAMRAAKAAGAVVSFDLNFREKLWNVWGGPSRAVDVIDRIARHVDVLIGNEDDIQRALGIPGPELAAVVRRLEQSECSDDAPSQAFEPGAYFSMIEKVVARYPNVKAMATTLREVLSATRHRWSALAWVQGARHVAPVCDLDVLDRVGGGDGFAAGFFYGLLGGEGAGEALRLGWAHGALLTTFPGDTTMATLEEVRALAAGASARIRR
ncbi:MAG TPA: PfkB family carbohydrate kinase [Polyangiaceae bacterium]|nr:PfkB family carbohydrate kinase [Polyangiaceae bacterium]